MDSPADALADAVAADRAAADAALAVRERYFAAPPAPPASRGFEVICTRPLSPARSAHPTGRELIADRPADRQRRYLQALRREGEAGDYQHHISGVTVLLEEEVMDLIAAPLRPHGRLLADALRRAARPPDRAAEKSAAFLDQWAGGREEPTLALVTLGLLFSARRGLEANDPAVTATLDAVFAPELVAAVRSNALATTLDWLRVVRNAACHPKAQPPRGFAFDAAGYQLFTRKLVGTDALRAWEQAGPTPAPPPPADAALHHLLCGSRLALAPDLPRKGAAADRLTALCGPRVGAFGLEVLVHRADRTTAAADPATRGMTVERVRGDGVLRVGELVVTRLHAERDGCLTLIDIDADGVMAVVLPNAECPDPRVPAGRPIAFPGPGVGEFAIRLTPPVGRGRVIALATPHRPPLPPVPTGGLFARLSDADADRLTEFVSRLSPADWAAAACDYAIAE